MIEQSSEAFELNHEIKFQFGKFIQSISFFIMIILLQTGGVFEQHSVFYLINKLSFAKMEILLDDILSKIHNQNYAEGKQIASELERLVLSDNLTDAQICKLQILK